MSDEGCRLLAQPGRPDQRPAGPVFEEKQAHPGRARSGATDPSRTSDRKGPARLNILDGTVIGRNMQRHRHQEFIGFLNTIEAQVPAG
jgi:hypothetical protein